MENTNNDRMEIKHIVETKPHLLIRWGMVILALLAIVAGVFVYSTYL